MAIVLSSGESRVPEPTADDLLDSWKEIAGYLKRSLSTVQRWEKCESLPVYRHVHTKQGTVYAFKSEVDDWWKDRRSCPRVPEDAPGLDQYHRGRPASTPSRVMLAVLPFANLSREPDQDYFSDGLTEELITRLGGSNPEGLGVIARTSVMRYRITQKPISEIGRELGVDYILEGSVRKAGEDMRITAQLIQVSDQTHLWAESYDSRLTDILRLQSEVAQAVTRRIGIKLTPRGQVRILQPRDIDRHAYDAYLQGRFHWHKLSRHHFDRALEYFELALKRDPNYALAYEGIAAVWLIRGDNGVVPPREARPKVHAAITKALELDDTLADVHKTLANFRFIFEWDWRGAEASFQRAIDLNPNHPDVRLFHADLLISEGRASDWEREIQRALDLDPFNFFLQCFLGWHLVYLGRYEKAIAQLRETLKSEPNFPSAHLGLWGALRQMRKYDEALNEAKTFFSAISDIEVAQALRKGHGTAGYAKAMLHAAEILAARGQKTYVPSIRIARLYAHAEQEGQALDWLEKAYEQREPPLVHLHTGWDWDNLRHTSRFQNLLRRMNLPQ